MERLKLIGVALVIWLGVGECICAEEAGKHVDAMWGTRAPLEYKIIPRPAANKHQMNERSYVPPPAIVQPVKAEPYAYGWFGTKPSPHWYRQFGAQRAYTQWTLR